MKTLFFALVIALSFAFSVPDKSFTGSFIMQTESSKNKDRVNTTQLYVKGAKVLVITSISNKPDKKFKSIVDGGAEVMYRIDDEKKIAMKVTLADMPQMPNTGTPEITPTDEYKTIDGYKCRKTNVVNKTSTREIWLTEDIDADFREVYKAFAYIARGSNIYAGLKGFPIKIITTQTGDGSVSTVTYKDIKIGNLDDSIFDLSGYKLMDIPTEAGK